MMIKYFNYKKPFTLEAGDTLPELQIAYTTSGILSPSGDNVIWVCHPLTGNADVEEWWPGIAGHGTVLDPDKYFIVCANMTGSCFGSTGPDSINPITGARYCHSFPLITIKDMVKGFQLLQHELGIQKIHLGIGGSMGGQQVLEWAVTDPLLFDNLFLIATNARHSAWGIAFNAAQRMAMEADPTFFNQCDDDYAGQKGLKAARAIALLSCRHQNAYRKTQTDFNDKLDDYKASSYQYNEGEKITRRFTAHAYYTLIKAMDTHNIGRSRTSVRKALREITARTMIIGIKSDLLFPYAEQKFLAANITDSRFKLIDSLYGHDGFLIEDKLISEHIRKFLEEVNSSPAKK